VAPCEVPSDEGLVDLVPDEAEPFEAVVGLTAAVRDVARAHADAQGALGVDRAGEGQERDERDRHRDEPSHGALLWTWGRVAGGPKTLSVRTRMPPSVSGTPRSARTREGSARRGPRVRGAPRAAPSGTRRARGGNGARMHSLMGAPQDSAARRGSARAAFLSGPGAPSPASDPRCTGARDARRALRWAPARRCARRTSPPPGPRSRRPRRGRGSRTRRRGRARAGERRADVGS